VHAARFAEEEENKNKKKKKKKVFSTRSAPQTVEPSRCTRAVAWLCLFSLATVPLQKQKPECARLKGASVDPLRRRRRSLNPTTLNSR